MPAVVAVRQCNIGFGSNVIKQVVHVIVGVKNVSVNDIDFTLSGMYLTTAVDTTDGIVNAWMGRQFKL